MHVERVEDPAVFREAIREHVLRDEPRHNLILGLARRLVEQPDVYPEFHLHRVVGADGETVAASLRTPPHLVVVTAPESPEALQALVDGIAAEGEPAPGTIGGLPEAQEFADRYAAATGRSQSLEMAQGIYVLREVADVPVPPGAPRRAALDDLDALIPWYRAFFEEAGPGTPWDEARTRRLLTPRLTEDGLERILLWEDGGPVSLAGCTGPTPSGIRVGPVYTPPERRGRGYATGLVAHLSRELLDEGRSFCFLYTDMDNPTSNAIYRRIGYRLHCGSAMIRFA
jgi:predicted GNAT family acetyltransferase